MFGGTAGALDGVVGGGLGAELDEEEEVEEEDDEELVEDDELVPGVVLDDEEDDDDDDEVDGGVLDELVLPFAAALDPLLEHAALSNPAAASSANPAAPRLTARRPLRIPASTMDSTLANAGPGRQPGRPFRGVATGGDQVMITADCRRSPMVTAGR